MKQDSKNQFITSKVGPGISGRHCHELFLSASCSLYATFPVGIPLIWENVFAIRDCMDKADNHLEVFGPRLFPDLRMNKGVRSYNPFRHQFIFHDGAITLVTETLATCFDSRSGEHNILEMKLCAASTPSCVYFPSPDEIIVAVFDPVRSDLLTLGGSGNCVRTQRLPKWINSNMLLDGPSVEKATIICDTMYREYHVTDGEHTFPFRHSVWSIFRTISESDFMVLSCTFQWFADVANMFLGRLYPDPIYSRIAAVKSWPEIKRAICEYSDSMVYPCVYFPLDN